MSLGSGFSSHIPPNPRARLSANRREWREQYHALILHRSCPHCGYVGDCEALDSPTAREFRCPECEKWTVEFDEGDTLRDGGDPLPHENGDGLEGPPESYPREVA